MWCVVVLIMYNVAFFAVIYHHLPSLEYGLVCVVGTLLTFLWCLCVRFVVQVMYNAAFFLVIINYFANLKYGLVWSGVL